MVSKTSQLGQEEGSWICATGGQRRGPGSGHKVKLTCMSVVVTEAHSDHFCWKRIRKEKRRPKAKLLKNHSVE